MVPLLDLGFSSLEHVSKLVALEGESKRSHEWMCSWEVVSFLDKFSFICDSTMYKLYCAEYDIPCDYTNEECAELATKYRGQLYTFQCDLLSRLIGEVMQKWTSYVNSGAILPKLPPTAKTALLNFVSIVNKMAESYVSPHFISMYASLAEAHKERDTRDMDVSDVQETITKDQFNRYCETFKGLFSKLFQSKDETLDQKLFNTRLGTIRKVLMTILWMCEPESPNRAYSSDVIFDRWILPYMEGDDLFKETLGKYAVRKSIPMAYALCVTPETIDLIPEDTDSYPITDAFRFMSTLLFMNQPIEQ